MRRAKARRECAQQVKKQISQQKPSFQSTGLSREKRSRRTKSMEDWTNICKAMASWIENGGVRLPPDWSSTSLEVAEKVIFRYDSHLNQQTWSKADYPLQRRCASSNWLKTSKAKMVASHTNKEFASRLQHRNPI